MESLKWGFDANNVSLFFQAFQTRKKKRKFYISLCFHAGSCSHVHLEKDAVSFYLIGIFWQRQHSAVGTIQDIMKRRMKWVPHEHHPYGGKPINTFNTVTSIIYLILIKSHSWGRADLACTAVSMHPGRPPWPALIIRSKSKQSSV